MSLLRKFDHQLSNFPPLARLVAAAAASGLIYFFIFTRPFLLTQFYNTIPPVDYTKLTGYSPAGFGAYLLGVGALFGLYIWALRLTAPTGQPAPTGPGFVFGSSAIFALILIFSYPLTAIDLFIYAIRTRGWALYGLPPLATPPEALPAGDPWLGLAGEWVDAPSPYGPLWEWLSLGGYYLSGGDFLAHLLTLKIIAALAFGGCVWLVYKILKQMRPNWAIAGTLAFAWNPLALFESVQNAHNDIVMVFFLLAALWVFAARVKNVAPGPPRASSLALSQTELRAWRTWALLFCLLMALSILVKFVTLIIAPFFWLTLAPQQIKWPRQLLWATRYGIITVGLVIAVMFPFWPGWENWAVPQAGSGAGRSLLALLVLGLRDYVGLNSAFDLSRNFILIVFALLYLFYLWQIFAATSRRAASKNLKTPIAAAFFTLFWYVLLAAPVFHAWYLLWFLPLSLLLLPRQRPLTATIVFSITALLVIPYFETIRVWYPALLRNHFWGHLIGVPLLILPPAVALLWGGVRIINGE